MSAFVTIEGIEGAGKSTLRSRLTSFASSLSHEVIITREPGATSLGRSIRSVVLDIKSDEEEDETIDPLAELMLFSADRAQHLAKVIRPALERGALVICDRYIHSTIAYQGYGRGLALDDLARLNQITTQGLRPDLVLLLDLDPEVGLSRAQARGRKSSGSYEPGSSQSRNQKVSSASWNRFDEESIEFHTKVRAGFLELAKDPANQFHVIDASEDISSIIEHAEKALAKLLGAKAN